MRLSRPPAILWCPTTAGLSTAFLRGRLGGASGVHPIAIPHERQRSMTAADVSFEYCKNPGDHNTICAAVDVQNPANRKKGVNAHGRPRGALNANLRAILTNKVSKLEGWNVANCAEIFAVDELLNAGVAAANIRVHSRDQKGNPKPPCENCQGWLEATEGGVYRIRP
jgi:hypothetical protein